MKYLLAAVVACSMLVVSVDTADAGRRRRCKPCYSKRCKPCYPKYEKKHAHHYKPICRDCVKPGHPTPAPKPSAAAASVQKKIVVEDGKKYEVVTTKRLIVQ